jgi:hypothetical protein
MRKKESEEKKRGMRAGETKLSPARSSLPVITFQLTPLEEIR